MRLLKNSPYLCSRFEKDMVNLFVMDQGECIVTKHFGDYIHYVHIDNETPTTGFATEHMLVFVFSGQMEITLNGRTRHIGAGKSFLLRRNHLCHKLTRPLKGEGFEGIFIYFKRPLLKKALAASGLSLDDTKAYTAKSPLVELPEHPYLESLRSSFLSYFQSDAFPSEQLITVKLIETVVTLIEIHPELSPVLFDFTGPMKVNIGDFMEQNFLLDMPLEELAHYTGRSLAGFKKEFTDTFGISPGRWVTQRRLREARHRIESLGESPIVAAEKCSFKDYSHFAHAFKKEYGITASEIKLS